jgi:predicted ATPase
LAELDPEPLVIRSSAGEPILSSVNDWISETPWYKDWKNGDESPTMLHIVGRSGSGLSRMVSKIVQLLRSGDHEVLTFSFSSLGSHHNTARLFSSLCQQMLQILLASKAHSLLCAWLNKDPVPTEGALNGLLSSLVSSYDGHGLICIIHGLHFLDSAARQKFSHDLKMVRKSSQKELKLILATDETYTWENAEIPCRVVDLVQEQQHH